MKRTLSVCLAVMLSVILMVGCSDSGKTSNSTASSNASSSSGEVKDEKITLTFLERWPNQPYKSYFESVAKEFEQKNPNININIVNALNDDYKQKINVMLGNNNPPDIFFSWVGEYGEKFMRDGTALDITAYVNEDKEWSDQIIESQFKPFSLDNKIYGVPFYMDSKFFFYNKDLFAKLQLQAPTTWDELMMVLKKIKDSGTTPIMLGNKSPWAAGHYLTTLNQRVVDANVLKSDYKLETAKFTDAGYIKALELMQQLIPYMNEGINAISHDDSRNTFINQKAAIMYLESLESPYLKDTKFEWGTFNFPSIPGGKGDQNELTGAPEGFMVSSKSKHPKEAVEFLKFLMSKENGEKLVKETGLTSVVKDTVTEQNSNDKERALIDQITSASNMAIWIDTLVDGKIFTPYLASLQEMLGGKKTPEQIMKDVQAAIK